MDQKPRLPREPTTHAPWFARFQRLVATKQHAQALRLVGAVIEEDLPLFDQEREISADRRVAWLCRIDLLRELGRFTEALAWVCLECELHPDNAAAQALKEELKRQTRFGAPPASTPARIPAGVVQWRGLAGMRLLRAELERDVILPLRFPEEHKRYKLGLPNGILLYGPPGCGKTFIARKLAEVIGFSFFDCSPSDTGSPYIHESQLRIRRLFDAARAKAPSLMFFDEFDALVPSRDSQALHHSYAQEVNEFLVQLNECHKARVLVVAATNFPQKIDSAVLRPGRIDKMIYVGPPDLEARMELLRLYMTGRPVVSVDYLALADESEDYTPAELEFVVNDAARAALVQGRSITQDDVLTALRRRPPALAGETKNPKRPIGF